MLQKAPSPFLPKDTMSLQMCGHNHLTAHIPAFFYFILPLFGQGQTWEPVDIPLPRVKSWRKLQSTQESERLDTFSRPSFLTVRQDKLLVAIPRDIK